MARKPITSKSGNAKSRGFALLIAIFILLLLTAIGAGMVTLTNTDTSISSNFRDEQAAYFGAKAGIEEVRDRLRSGPTAPNTIIGNAYFTGSALPGQTSGVLYITNANPLTGDTVTPWVTNGAATVYPDDEICTEIYNLTGTACGPSGPSGSWYVPAITSAAAYAPATGQKLPWKWARITAKTNLTSSGTSNGGSSQASVDGNLTHNNYRVCWNGANEVAIPNTTSCAAYAATPPLQPVYVITALAQTPSGSRRMVQAETTMTTFPSIPGPLVFDGPSPQFSTPSSNAFQVNGNNQSAPGNASGPGSSCPSGQPAEYALGAFNSAAATTLQSVNRPTGYVGLGGTPSVGDVSSQLGTLATVGGLQALTSEITLIAGNEGNVYTSSRTGLTNPGTIASPQVNVVEGDLTLSGALTGAGILLVTGTLTMNGNPTYDGLILVVGKGAVVKNGGGNGTVDGSMLVANMYSGTPPTYGSLLPSSSAPGIPSVQWNGGGNVQWNYDSCWSSAMGQSLAWRIVGMREIIR